MFSQAKQTKYLSGKFRQQKITLATYMFQANLKRSYIPPVSNIIKCPNLLIHPKRIRILLTPATETLCKNP